jgi:hypothetical protein
LREPRTTIGGVNLVAGFRPELWSKVAPNAAPAGVAGFNSPLVGPSGYTLFGRRKADSQELDPRPPTSHVARTDQDEFGKIFRRNVAYGTLTDHGTIFVGFSRDQAILQRMLESMVGLGDGPSDRLTTVTRALRAPTTSARPPMPSLRGQARARGTTRPEGRSAAGRVPLLLVALDDLRRPDLGFLGVEPELPPRLALVEEVVALVELDGDRVQSGLLVGTEAAAVSRLAPQLFLFVRQLVDPVE